MRDGPPPRAGRGAYGPGSGNPAASGYRNARPSMPPRTPDDPGRSSGAYGRYQPQPGPPYQSGPRQYPTLYNASAGRMPAAYAPPAEGGWTEAEIAATRHHRLGIAIFHDANPGHLWRGEVASRLGEAVLSAGVIMWIASFLQSPLAVAAAVVALALPAVITGPFAAPLENAEEPGVLLRRIGRVRFVLALGLIAMHFHTIVPVIYALLFAISFCGRLRDALRTAAVRTCLAPGEPDNVANDMHVGASVAAVLGPLLATLFFILLGERILLVSFGAAIFFLISANSEGFLDPLPERRRAFLLATPASVALDRDPLDVYANESEDDELGDMDPQERRELGLPEWYQQGPETPADAIADIRAGLGLAGTTPGGTAAFWALTALALVGGGFAVLEVFYLIGAVGMPSFYLGPLLAAEAAGMAFGVLLGSDLAAGAGWRVCLIGGVLGSGAALVVLARLPAMPVILVAALGLGLANALAVLGARHAFTAGFTGVERRAIAAAETWIAALAATVGAATFVLFLDGARSMPGLSLPHALTKLPTWPIGQLVSLMGGGLIAAGILSAVAMALVGGQPRPRKAKLGKKAKSSGKHPNKSGSRGRVPDDLPPAGGDGEAWDDEDGYEQDDDYDEEYAAAERYDYGDTGYQDAAGYDDEYDEPPPPPWTGRRPRGW
jgi:hypothetical protein